MSARERAGLVARIRRAIATAEKSATPSAVPREQEHLRALEARVERLEQLVQGLQDSVHRESSRHAKRIAQLEARVQPGALAKALSDDARERGL